MPKQLDETALRLSLIIAQERQRVRGRHSRQATAELNVSIPRIERDFWSAVQGGRLPELNEFAPVDPGVS